MPARLAIGGSAGRGTWYRPRRSQIRVSAATGGPAGVPSIAYRYRSSCNPRPAPVPRSTSATGAARSPRAAAIPSAIWVHRTTSYIGVDGKGPLDADKDGLVRQNFRAVCLAQPVGDPSVCRVIAGLDDLGPAFEAVAPAPQEVDAVNFDARDAVEGWRSSLARRYWRTPGGGRRGRGSILWVRGWAIRRGRWLLRSRAPRSRRWPACPR